MDNRFQTLSQISFYIIDGNDDTHYFICFHASSRFSLNNRESLPPSPAPDHPQTLGSHHSLHDWFLQKKKSGRLVG